MNNLRKGALIGMFSGLVTLFGLFLNLFEMKIKDPFTSKEEILQFSINSIKSWSELPSEGQEAWGVIFNIFLAFAILTIVFSFLSNKRNFLAIMTILISLGNLGFAFLIYKTGSEAFKDVPNFASFSFGIGMYLLLGGAILGVIGAVLALIKK